MAGRSYLWWLAFAEDGQQKWVTQDQATLVTQHGRLVKTLLGGDNLIEVNNLAADPLIKPAQIVDGATWTRTMGWTEYQQVRYATARSVFKWDGTDTVKSAAMKPRFVCWTKKSSLTRRAGITAIGSTAKGKFASRNSISARIISR
ncbi:lipoprotein yjbF [Escherichia coli]|nr:lipoprotein yjbF [Escherichia coli]